MSIENPEWGYIWELRHMKDLLQMPGVRDVCGDQCCFGAPSVKPTRWRGNAPWLTILEKRCPGQPLHLPHIKLRG